MTDGSDQWDACIDHLYDSVGLEDRLTEALSLFGRIDLLATSGKLNDRGR
jgi:hypothetical protein